jgi:hypothetical protein
MSSRHALVGTVQSGVKNVFAGATVYTLASQADPFTGTLRLAISGSAGTNPTTWIVRVQQGIWSEEWVGETYGGTSIVLTLADLFFISGEAITVTLENTATADINVTVDAGLYSEINALTTLGATAPAGWLNAAAFAANSITTTALADNLITAAKLAANCISATAVASGTLTAAKFASGAFDAVWSVATRTLSAFGFSVTVGTNNDKSGYSLTATTGLGNQTANITGNLSGSVGSVTGNVGGSVGSVTSPVTVGTNNDKTGYALSNDGRSAIISDVRSDIERTGGMLDTVPTLSEIEASNVLAKSTEIDNAETNLAQQLDDVATELAKVPRAASPIAAGKYRWSIEGGQSANITPGAPV